MPYEAPENHAPTAAQVNNDIMAEISAAAVKAAGANLDTEPTRGAEIDALNVAKFVQVVNNALTGRMDATSLRHVAAGIAEKASAGHAGKKVVSFE